MPVCQMLVFIALDSRFLHMPDYGIICAMRKIKTGSCLSETLWMR